MQKSFQIVGSGSDLPGSPVPAREIERRANLPDGWIDQHTMVHVRHECTSPETLLTMAKRAAERALSDAKLDWSAIDLIIDGSTSRYQPIPCNAAVFQAAIGPAAEGIACFDVHATCLGFLTAVNVANSLLAVGDTRRVLIVCSEAPLLAVNWSDPESATLLGDGAAAVVLERTTPSGGLWFRQQTFGEFQSDCELRGGSHRLPAWQHTAENHADYQFDMNGPKLFQTALRKLHALVDQLLQQSQIDRTELLVIPHQASPRALELIRRRLGFREDQFINRAAETGNLAAASIPLLLDQLRRESSFPANRPLLLLGTSAGYSQAGMILVP